MKRTSFDRGWTVRREGSSSAPSEVTLPHDAMLFEQRDPHTPNGHHTGYFPGGAYRYAKRFVAPEEWRDRHIALEFEGVYMRSQVVVNGIAVGGRPSGYAVFHVALDDVLRFGDENEVEVIARNDLMPNSRWYTGSGIYRPVSLLVGGSVHVTPMGLRVVTRSVRDGHAVLDVAVTVANTSDRERTVTVDSMVAGATGERLASAGQEVVLEPAATTRIDQEVAVADAALWSPSMPALHRLAVRLDERGVTLDEAVTTFGIRTLELDARRGLRINGGEVKLRGACFHHDNGVIGAHTLAAAEDRRVRILKECGYNAIRSAHNPISRATLEACDRHGMLVMDELTDVWWRDKTPWGYSLEFEEWWERDLEAMIANDINHPSVIFYSIGNEIAETATPRGIALNRRIAERVRELDPSRFVTNGINGFLNLIASTDDVKLARKAEDRRVEGGQHGENLITVLNLLMGVFQKVLPLLLRLRKVDERTREAFAALDAAGYNHMPGRYRVDAASYPDRVIVGTETVPRQTISIWRDIAALPNVVGDFVWTGWDYVGEAGLASVEYGTRRSRLFKPYPALLAGTPIVDITGHRQLQSFVNQIAWGQLRGPVLAVRPVDHAGEATPKSSWRITDAIRSWSWEGCEGGPATVEVFADAARVELLLDGRRVGSRRISADMEHRATFELAYQPGTLTAVAFDEFGAELGRDSLTSAGPELVLRLEPEVTTLRPDGHDLAYIRISLVDAHGIVRPLADRPVTLEVVGAASLLGFGSAAPLSEEGFHTRTHKTYQGRALAVLRAGFEEGPVVVTAHAPGCDSVTASLVVQSG